MNPMTLILTLGAVLLAADAPPEAQAPPPAEVSKPAPAALAEYNARRTRLPDTADARWKLGLWCEQAGLKGEATLEFLAVTRLDPRREPAWKKLGYQKQNGRWMSAETAAAERAEAAAQRKADAHWRPLLQKLRGQLAQESRKSDASAALTAVDDPRSVPSIWRVFAVGGAADQERAVDMLGHIEGDRASRALAGLAVFGKTDVIRRAAVATLLRRPHEDVLMAWIGLLRDPIKYDVRQVAGPGSPGVLMVEDERFNVRRFYAPPSVEQIEGLFINSQNGRPTMPLQFNSSPPGPPPGSRAVGSIGNTDLYIFDYHWALPKLPKSIPDPTPSYQQFERNQLQAKVNADFEFGEAARMADGAQAQLEHDVNVVESANTTIRGTNARVLEALRRVSGQVLGPDREEWLRWWMEHRGYSYVPPKQQSRATIDMEVALPYVPASGPPNLTAGGGGGGGRGWCLIWDKEKGQPPQTHQCFAAGTSVLTADGTRAIETLNAGDRVLTAEKPERGMGSAMVVRVHRSRSPGTRRIVLPDETIVTTDGHPFWKYGSGWTRAGDLKPGDALFARGGPVPIASVESSAEKTVWNLELSDGSGFFVGEAGVLVHDLRPMHPAIR
jgi:hypothetical protein